MPKFSHLASRNPQFFFKWELEMPQVSTGIYTFSYFPNFFFCWQNSSLSLNQEQQHLAVPHHWKQKQTSPNTSRSSKEKNQTGLASKTKDMNRLGIAWRQNSVNSLETKRHSSWAKGPKRQYGLENEAEFHYFQTICNISVNKNKNQKE